MTTKQDVAAASIDDDMKPILDGLIDRIDALEAREAPANSGAAMDFAIALLQADRATEDKDSLYAALNSALAQYAGN